MKTPLLLSITGYAFPLFAAASIASASTLTWDSSGANLAAPTNGSGTWSTSNTNWTDGTTESSWPSGTSGSNYNAVFGGGSGTGGTITLGGVIVCGTATFNTSGYVLTGGTLSMPVSGGTGILVAANVSAEIDSYIQSVGTNITSVLAGGTLTLRGGQSLGSNGTYLTTTTSTVVLASGTYSGSVVNAQGNVVVGEVGSSNVAQFNGSTLQIGYGSSGTTSYVSANASSTVTNTLNIGRYGTGVLDLKAGTITMTGSNNVTVGVTTGASNSALLIKGGTFNISNTASKLIINGGATSANGSASVLVSGGVLNAPAIQFGSGSTAFAATTSGTFQVSGGTVYLGVSGSTVAAIAVNATAAPVTNVILLSGGTLAATGDWTSSMAMTLSSANGGVTFQAANSSGVSHNITLSGTLSGNGSLTKTGAGILTLSGNNTYTGVTTVSEGELDLNNTSGTAIAGNLLVNGGVAKLLAASQIASGQNLTVSSGTFDLQSYNQSVANVQLTGGVIQGSGTLSSSNAYDVQAGTISANLAGSVGLNKTTSGNATLSGNNSYTGATSVTGGTLTLNGSLAAGSAVSVNGATLAGSGYANGSVAGTNATINGSGLSIGATTLNGSSTLSGYNIASSVTVNSGTTSLTGTTQSTATLSVSAGATLNANGTIAGSASVSGLLSGSTTVTGNLALTSGTLSPGNSPGLTTVEGNFTMDKDSTLVAQVSGTVAGISYDQVKVSGIVTLDGTLDLTTLSGLTLGDKITLIDNTGTGTTTGYFATILTSGSTFTVTSNADYTFTVGVTDYLLSYNTSSATSGASFNDVTLTVVPEPGTWAMLVGGLGMLAFGQQLRRRVGQ